MNKVLVVGELIMSKTLQTSQNGSIMSFVIATVRIPKDTRKPKELHFIYCKTFGKAIPEELSKAQLGDIISVSGQIATVVTTNDETNLQEYQMEVWVENLKRMPEPIRNQNINNSSKQIGNAIRSYGKYDSVGEKAIHILNNGSEKTAKDEHIEVLKNAISTESEVTEPSNQKEKTASLKEKVLA